MNLTRREFLVIGGAVALSACNRDRPPEPASDLLLGGGRYRKGPDAPLEFVLSTVDIARAQRATAALDFFPHGIHLNPAETRRVAIFEKIGPGACEFDREANRVVRPIEATKDHWFYGHGTYTADGQWLLCTEAQRTTTAGRIAIRDARSLELAGVIPSHGHAPHECKLIDGGKTLVVTNGGGPMNGPAPCVSYIDLASEKLLEKHEPSNSRLNTGHLAVADDGSLVVVSAPRKGLENGGRGGVSIASPGRSLKTLTHPVELVNQMLGEALSVAIHNDSRTVAVTHPDANLLTLWRLADAEFIAEYSLDRPRGVALSRDLTAFIVSCGSAAGLLRLPLDTLVPEPEPIMRESYITGSHLFSVANHFSEMGALGPTAA